MPRYVHICQDFTRHYLKIDENAFQECPKRCQNATEIAPKRPQDPSMEFPGAHAGEHIDFRTILGSILEPFGVTS